MMYWLLHNTTYALPAAQRGVAAFLTATGVSLVLGIPIIRWLRRLEVGERTDTTPIEDEELRRQINAKDGTPTMGGLIIFAGLLPACALWGNPLDPHLWLALMCFGALFALGMVDDWMKLTGKGKGMKVRYKLVVQGLLGAGLGVATIATRQGRWQSLVTSLEWIPITVLAAGMVVWFALVISTMSNAVNVTDGLDGLAGALSLVALAPICWVSWHSASGAAGSREMLIFAGGMGGSVIGFLWHNWHPAQVFMGDTGSLALGGSIGLLALLTGLEFALPIIGFIFLMEFGSSVLQVLWFKATGRRILPIAPLHHIWQQRGLPETKIVFRFCVVALIVLFAGSPLL